MLSTKTVLASTHTHIDRQTKDPNKFRGLIHNPVHYRCIAMELSEDGESPCYVTFLSYHP